MKKLRMMVLALIIALVPTSAFANTGDVTPLGAGEWDIILKSNYTVYDYHR
ncbi:hypothetical protein JOC86_002208 [Bacillus pakistanensis]|uniref:Uncharacterized protein n=1 Tax=Rossellomorea pakistanensis TaxID=992288 RepID=A0ABS2NCU9_9BACI|nr:hypothetical protein [Bacillus pakistanensis]MBM7585666.1 hypothetical protein [Bacillus pakistanensis]